jgi:hypothetical protein
MASIFSSLFGGPKREPEAPALPIVRNVTIGRTLVLDPLAWRRLGGQARFQLDRDTLEITAQGQIELAEGGFVHRFYTDDDIMFQAVSDDPEGETANDFTLFVPWRSRYPGNEGATRAWIQRLTGPNWREDDLPDFERFWFPPEDGEQPPVSFWETVWDDRQAMEPYARIYQTCMLYAREIGEEGRELLLAIAQDPEGGDLTHELMLGVPLAMGEFRA